MAAAATSLAEGEDERVHVRILVIGPRGGGKTALLDALWTGGSRRQRAVGLSIAVSLARCDDRDVVVEWLEIGGSVEGVVRAAVAEADAFHAILVVLDGTVTRPADVPAVATGQLQELFHYLCPSPPVPTWLRELPVAVLLNKSDLMPALTAGRVRPTDGRRGVAPVRQLAGPLPLARTVTAGGRHRGGDGAEGGGEDAPAIATLVIPMHAVPIAPYEVSYAALVACLSSLLRRCVRRGLAGSSHQAVKTVEFAYSVSPAIMRRVDCESTAPCPPLAAVATQSATAGSLPEQALFRLVRAALQHELAQASGEFVDDDGGASAAAYGDREGFGRGPGDDPGHRDADMRVAAGPTLGNGGVGAATAAYSGVTASASAIAVGALRGR